LAFGPRAAAADAGSCGIVDRVMSPTVSARARFGFLLFAEEERLHVHVQSADGEAKFWIAPEIELARNYKLSDQDVSRSLQLVVDHEQEIRDAWNGHFGP